MRLTNFLSNSSAICFRDDESLRRDAGLAVVLHARLHRGRDRRSRSALGITMKGSLPPSSSTTFLMSLRGGNAHLDSRLLTARQRRGHHAGRSEYHPPCSRPISSV